MSLTLTTRQLINQIGNFPGTRLDYDGRIWTVAYIAPIVDGLRISLWPDQPVTWAGIGHSFEIPTSDLDLPMWNVSHTIS
jgi:hypothetical protein